MLVREVSSKDREAFDKAAEHPLQSFEWGEFRKKTGVAVERAGVFEGDKLTAGYQVTIHKVPKTSYNVGYFPKGPETDETQLKILKDIGDRNNCVMVKLEPNVGVKVKEGNKDAHKKTREFLMNQGCQEGRSLFTRYTFQIDLMKSEEELLAAMKSKTRYNVRLAERSGVKIVEDSSVEAFEEYLKLTEETTKRQRFYAHSLDYHRKMWKEMHKADIARLLLAKWQDKTLVAWVVFVFNDVLYYPYGASSSQKRELMASNLMMWEAIKYGKRMGCKTFDLWGSLGPDPDKKDPWYGFHRFKEGYGGDLVEFVGTYDLVLKPQMYKLYRLADEARWKFLRAKAAVRNFLP